MADSNGHEVERSKEPRRVECVLHREEMDVLQKAVSDTQKTITDTQRDVAATRVDVGKSSGKYASMMWFLGAVGAILGAMLTMILSKTSSIESLLSDNKVLLMQHSERIDGLRKEVDEIKTRNTYIDQQQLQKAGGKE